MTRDTPNGQASTASVLMTMGQWQGSDITASQVESALSDLRRKERRAAVRASVLTLVVVVEDQAEADAALAIIHELGTRHPSRTIVLVVGPHEVRGPHNVTPGHLGRPSGRDAVVRVHAADAERPLFFEEIVITIRGQGRHHLNSIVEPLALPDVRMVVWLPSRLPSPGDPLMAAADRVVVDSRAVAGPSDNPDDSPSDSPSDNSRGVLSRSAVLSRQLPVTDLSWVRMTPWRSLLAGLFEGHTTRPFLDGITRVEVSGNPGPRHLLGGWMLRRLKLPLDRIELKPAEHVSIEMHSEVGRRAAHFSVRRPTADRVIHASVAIDDGPHWDQILSMREQWAALALADSLTQMGRDQGYEEALGGALELQAVGGQAVGGR